MRTILKVFLILSTSYGYCQSVFRPSSVIVEKDCSETDIAGYNKFVNNFKSTNLRFLRIQNTLSPKWTSAYCDCELCHSVDTDSANFFIKIGDSCTTSGHFYPDNTKGSGRIKIKVYDPNDRSNFVIAEYIVSCNTASFVFLKKEQLSISPNPALSSINVLFGPSETYEISIASAEGKLLINKEVEGLNHNFDISALDPGLYSVIVESAGKVYFAKFIKL